MQFLLVLGVKKVYTQCRKNCDTCLRFIIQLQILFNLT